MQGGCNKASVRPLTHGLAGGSLGGRGGVQVEGLVIPELAGGQAWEGLVTQGLEENLG